MLKSSALIGGSSVVNVALGVVRTKVLALLIGTGGMGLFGAFSSATALVSGIAGMGINISGVRHIAEAVGSNDQLRIARTARVLRRTSLVLGTLGMLVFLILCRPISIATFGTPAYAAGLGLLSVTILFAEVTAGQTALIQGLRRIGDLAALSIWGAVLGTVFSIPIIFLWREKGIVPFLVTVSALAIATSWWYARRIKVEKVPLPLHAVWNEARTLLVMGGVFMTTGLMTTAVAYLTRVMVIRQLGLESAGLYQAAYTLSGVYVGFILGAMGADYYPRLTAVAGDNVEVNRLVNEQAEAALLLAVPGILGTLTFAPWVIHLLYSAQFAPAGEILRWQLLGILGRIITWPVGFVLLAKGNARLFFCTELACNLVHLSLIWYGMKWFGLSGLGMAFFGLYVFAVPMTLIVVQRLSGFHWSQSNFRLGIGAILATAAVFFATSTHLRGVWGMVIGGLITTAAGLYSLRRMALRAGCASLGDAWGMLRARFRRQTA